MTATGPNLDSPRAPKGAESATLLKAIFLSTFVGVKVSGPRCCAWPCSWKKLFPGNGGLSPFRLERKKGVNT